MDNNTIADVKPGLIQIKTTFINKYKQTQTELDYKFVEGTRDIDETISFLHQQFVEYYGAKSDVKSTWRYYNGN